VLNAALASNETELVRMTLRELIGLPNLALSEDPLAFVDDPRPELRIEAAALKERMETGSAPDDYS
jgi:hypothetical protein